MHLSRVDFPDPLRPEDADGLALVDLEGDVPQGPQVLVRDPAGVDDPLLQRGVLLLVQAEPLGDLLDVDRGGHSSELLGEVALEPAEDDQRQHEEGGRDRRARSRRRTT